VVRTSTKNVSYENSKTGIPLYADKKNRYWPSREQKHFLCPEVTMNAINLEHNVPGNFASMLYFKCIEAAYVQQLALTPQGRALLEKLTVIQSRNHSSLWNPKVHYRVHKSPTADLQPDHKHPVHIFPTYLFKIHSNIILQSTPRSSD